ncbi:glycine betaine ABC transporter substrate-binding protein [Sporolactobacillus sp. CQH2019]|uniref:ABC transporter substrate-binding protein n=1 Tax=Sporolactobacillus sp. CQH2019 TaxID=3023512 RepID=UPI002368BDD6|nr:glycine betaine ABC transporter substrate-binding protein [Sporolactobacillus sp. CQH2019]MDD9150810.1 glycine betaine ABC transporter substrate-binding protein [Sporolactobacillus sp. CQH2019]
MKTRRLFIGLSIFAVVVIAGLILIVSLQNNKPSSSSSATSAKTITIGSKNFTESLILGEMYADALENAGYKVNRKLNLGGTLVAHEALVKGDIDMYPEYTGTGLLDILKHSKVTDAGQVYQDVSQAYKKKWNLIWLQPTHANDSQGLAVSKTISDKYNIHTFSDLAKAAPDINFAATPEFNDRPDGLKGLQQAYGGFRFKTDKLYDYGLKYNVLLNGKADATVAFTTDGQLTDKNLVLLTDDKHFYPPYYVCPVIRGSVVKNDPTIETIINKVSSKVDSQAMQQLNAQVDIQKKTYQQVAREFLVKQGLIKS